MKNNHYCFLYCLFFGILCHFVLNNRAEPILKSNILAMIDGTKYVPIADIIQLKNDIHRIMNEEIIIKNFPPFTFKIIVSLQHKMSKKENALILKKFIQQFEKIIKKHGQKINRIKKLTHELIIEWIGVRKKENTSLILLPDWIEVIMLCKKNIFYEKIKSLSSFQFFLEDLHLFLEDIISSLPKSYKLYKKTEQ